MKKLSTKEMKNISYTIISKELQKHNLEAIIYPVSVFEYYTKYIPNKYLSDKNNFIKLLKLPFIHALACNLLFDDKENNIIIFLDKFKNKDKQLLNLINTCFHEIRHSIQQTFDDYSYNMFLRKIDCFLKKCFPYNYQSYHDCYSYEIGSNIYAITMTKEFLKNNYPTIYQEEKNNIEKREENIRANYILYDATDRVNQVINTARSMQISINNISPIFNIFINSDNSFKSIKDIIKHPNFKKLDKRIIYAVLTSDSFFKSIDIEKISSEELVILNESLQYTHTVYHNQIEFCWKNRKNIVNNTNAQSIINWMTSIKRISQRQKIIDKYMTLLNNSQNKEQYQYEFIKKRIKENNIEIL